MQQMKNPLQHGWRAGCDITKDPGGSHSSYRKSNCPCASEFAWRTTKCDGWHVHKLKIQMTRLTVNPSVAENEADAEAKVSIQFLGLVTAT
jgi:hypothetical protein